jgi:hypothetical protein
MIPNQATQIHGVGSSPPTLPCPYCPRRFYRKGGRTRHIQAKHPDSGSEPLSPAGPAAYPAPISPLAQQSFRGSSSIPSNFTPPLPPSQYGFDVDTNTDREIDADADPPHVTRTSHPKLDGMSIFF